MPKSISKRIEKLTDTTNERNEIQQVLKLYSCMQDVSKKNALLGAGELTSVKIYGKLPIEWYWLEVAQKLKFEIIHFCIVEFMSLNYGLFSLGSENMQIFCSKQI